MRGSHDLDPKLDRFTQCPPQQVLETGDERTDVRRFWVEGLPPTEGEELRRQLRAILGCVQRLFDMLALAGSADMGIVHFQIGDDRCQEIVEIVRDAAGKLTDRLHLLRLLKLLFHLLAAREVAHESSEDSFSVRVRLPNSQFHRENCAVLGEAVDQPAITDNSRFAGPEIIGEVLAILGPVGFRHEHLDIAADSFLGTIPE
jgi:hypothetical protein